MKRILTGALAALTLAGGAVAGAAPASAQPWHGGYWHGGYHGWGPGAAIGAGVLGLAVGATIASSHPYYGYGYGYPAYGYGYGYAPPVAYAPCATSWRWNPYWGRYQRVSACY